MGGTSEQWQRELQRYMAERRISYFFWALNGNSASVGGICAQLPTRAPPAGPPPVS